MCPREPATLRGRSQITRGRTPASPVAMPPPYRLVFPHSRASKNPRMNQRVARWSRSVWKLRAAVFDYIEVFYNRQRHQAGLEHLAPYEYKQRVTAA